MGNPRFINPHNMSVQVLDEKRNPVIVQPFADSKLSKAMQGVDSVFVVEGEHYRQFTDYGGSLATFPTNEIDPRTVRSAVAPASAPANTEGTGVVGGQEGEGKTGEESPEDVPSSEGETGSEGQDDADAPTGEDSVKAEEEEELAEDDEDDVPAQASQSKRSGKRSNRK